MTPVLQITDLVKTFGGLIATDHVTLDVKPGEIHALIGPNGAGKTTLINQISGELMSNAGSIHLGGKSVTGMTVAARTRLGLGRTFQITSLLDEWTVRQNLGMAIQSRRGGNMRIFDRVVGRTKVWDEAEAMLRETDLSGRLEHRVADLAHGEKKQLELLMAMAMKPRILLLDEPMAGLGHVESQLMIKALLSSKGTIPMLLVEHDMDAVFALADRISVLVYGRVIASGTADEIRANPEVREAYLGEEDA